MKKAFLSWMVAAAGLLAASCSSEMDESINNSNQANASFSIVLNGQISTRAVSDGTSATKLIAAAYNKDGELVATQEATFANLNTTVEFQLAKGHTYSFAFWAQSPECTAYTFDTEKAEVNISYEKVVANDESRDAFFANRLNMVVSGDFTEKITLKRPFAQLNFGIENEEWATLVKQKALFETSEVTVSNVSKGFNLLTGKAQKGQEVTFAMADFLDNLDGAKASHTAGQLKNVDLAKFGIPRGEGKKDFAWLSMNYILVDDATEIGADKAIVDTKFTFTPTVDEAVVIEVPNVPVQRNWRTNIIGSLVYTGIFNIEIDPNFDDERNGLPFEGDEDQNGLIMNEEQLIAAAQKGGEYTLGANITLDETVRISEGVNFILNGGEGFGVTSSDDYYLFQVYGEMTINATKDNKFTNTGTGAVVCTTLGGKATLNGGTYYKDYDETKPLYYGVIGSINGTIVINDGRFALLPEDSYNIPADYFSSYQAGHLLYANNPAEIVVKGGDYLYFDPATDWIISGCTTSKVVESIEDYPASNCTWIRVNQN